MAEWIKAEVELPSNGQKVEFWTIEDDLFLGYWDSSGREWQTIPSRYSFANEAVKWWRKVGEPPTNTELQKRFGLAYCNLIKQQEQRGLMGEIVEAAYKELKIEISPFQAAVLWYFSLCHEKGGADIDDAILQFIEKFKGE